MRTKKKTRNFVIFLNEIQKTNCFAHKKTKRWHHYPGPRIRETLAAFKGDSYNINTKIWGLSKDRFHSRISSRFLSPFQKRFKGTVWRKLTWAVRCDINRQLMVSSCSNGHFYLFKGPSLFEKRKRVFSVKRHFVVEWPVNIETASNACDCRAQQTAITVIVACVVPLPMSKRLVEIRCKFILACSERINTATGFAWVAAELYKPL
jgi:hypothetical protein